MQHLRFFAAILLFVPFAAAVYAAESEYSEPRISFSGAVGWESGQLVKARYWTSTFNHIWFDNNIGSLHVKAIASDRLTVRLGISGRVWYNTFPIETIKEYNAGSDRYASIDIREAQGIMSLIKDDALNLELALGIMPYKYNPDATDLGEYLFRTGTYPAYILNNFDAAVATVSGVRAGATYAAGAVNLNLDQFVLYESEIRPFHDITLATVAGCDIMKMAQIGAGVSFAHLIPVDSRITTPELPNTAFETAPGDTGHYTFTGTKLMARASIDPLFSIRKSDIGKLLGQGGKIYGEAAVLGLKDYPATTANTWGYDTLSQKMPKMFGVTVPVPYVLDLLALEFEHYSCPYPLNYAPVFQKGWPFPTETQIPDSGSDYTKATYRNDSWKWSVYARKQITPNVRLCGQIARDHQRWEAHISHLRNYDFEDALVKPDQWAWHLKAEFTF